ncbi:unnamed protein product [Timema podura]|uniref:Ig-like domain-containing protein n=1 Tax=Timema podura TaxID=61482 RepID=A0ABN7NHL5_TIMPD|nr:unnamed protein product [Timema podura]
MNGPSCTATNQVSGVCAYMDVPSFSSQLTRSPERNLELNQVKPDIDSVNISCRAQGVYPEPKMALYKDRDRTNGLILKGVVVESTSKGGEYDIIAYKVIQDEDLQSPTEFDCELRIPEANYVVRKSIVYYTGKSAPAYPTEIQTSISPSLVVELNMTSALINYATKKAFDWLTACFRSTRANPLSAVICVNENRPFKEGAYWSAETLCRRSETTH